MVRGILALEPGRFEDAISAFREAGTDHLSSCLLCAASDLGIAFDRAGEADSAIAYYEHYLDTAWGQRIFEDPLRLPWTLERLARLLDERDETEKAAARYAEFVSLWEKADPELQPRVEPARKRLEEILAARGWGVGRSAAAVRRGAPPRPRRARAAFGASHRIRRL